MRSDAVTYSQTIGRYDFGIGTLSVTENATQNVTSQDGQNNGDISNKGVSYGNGYVGVQSTGSNSGVYMKIGGSTFSLSSSGVGMTIPTGNNTSNTYSIAPNPGGLATAGAAIAGGVVTAVNYGEEIYNNVAGMLP